MGYLRFSWVTSGFLGLPQVTSGFRVWTLTVRDLDVCNVLQTSSCGRRRLGRRRRRRRSRRLGRRRRRPPRSLPTVATATGPVLARLRCAVFSRLHATPFVV